jgi:hypothetical protein
LAKRNVREFEYGLRLEKVVREKGWSAESEQHFDELRQIAESMDID